MKAAKDARVARIQAALHTPPPMPKARKPPRNHHKPMTRQELEQAGYVFRSKYEETQYAESWERLEQVSSWDDLAVSEEANYYLQSNILFHIQQSIDSDGGIIERVGGERPKQVMICRMHMHIARLAIAKLRATMKKPEPTAEVPDDETRP
jgi:hypothetical protein